ncbi:MAG: glycosyltransferase [Bacteroidales bacterium]|nr:glycosyltransferase [Bacteroidales bacterium]
MKTKLKIFVLLSRIPWPLEKGDKLRAFHQIKSLSVSSEIILCALNSDSKADKQSAFRALQPYCKSVTFIDLPRHALFFNLLRAFLNGKPLQTGYFFNAKAFRQVNSLILKHKPDLIYAQLLRVAEYVRSYPLPKTLDYQDVFSMGMKRRMELASWPFNLFYRFEYKRLLRYEAEVFDDFNLKTIISYPDRDLIPHPDRDQIMVVPNGVDHQFFRPIDAEKKYDLVFTGNMAYPPNVNAALFLCREVMPLVWKIYPETKVLLAGATPDRQLLRLQDKRITVSGWMDDIRDAYASARIFIAPMKIGTGLQNKLLEAMSMKLPCITTPLAFEPLKAQKDVDVLVGETASELAELIQHLLRSNAFATQVANHGYDFVIQNYNWDASTGKLLSAMEKLPREKHGTTNDQPLG